MKNRTSPLLLLTGLAAFSPLAASAGNLDGLTLSVGFDYSNGKYGTTTTTDITSIPVTARYDSGSWSYDLTVPYIRITGTTDVLPRIGRIINTNPNRRTATATSTSSTADGLGDISASATYYLYQGRKQDRGISLTGLVKFGTADANAGLGTGENDYTLQANGYRTWGKNTVYGSVAYSALGSSQYIQLDNVWSLSAGAEHQLTAISAIGISYYARQKTNSAGSAASDATLYYTRNIGNHWKAQAYVLQGFSNGSPDNGIGASMAYAF